MLARKAIFRWLLAVGLAVPCCGCGGGVLPWWFGGRGHTTVHRRAPPQPAPPLRIAEPPGLPTLPWHARLLAPIPEPEEVALSTPPLVARAPAGDARPHSPAGDLRTLHRLAAERYAQTGAYTVRVRRREPDAGRQRHEEVVYCKFRKEPRTAYFKWVGEEGNGRELIYAQGRQGDVIHVLTAAGDLPLMPLAGKHVKAAPDSALVKSISRHSFADSGIGGLIERFGAAVDAAEHAAPDAGTLAYQGILRRSEYDQPLEAVLHVVPAGGDPDLPGGGERLWFFDLDLRFPVLVITHDPHGEEVGYCCYDQFSFPEQLSDDEFDPEVLWSR